MVNERSTDAGSEAQIANQVTNRNLLDGKRFTHHSPFNSRLNNITSDLDLTQKDSVTSLPNDCATRRDWDVVTAILAEAQRISSDSALKTPREDFEESNIELHTAVSSKKEDGKESGGGTGIASVDFSLTRMFPSFFGRSATTLRSASSIIPQNSRPTTELPSRNSTFKFPQAPKKPKNSRQDVLHFRSDYANKYAIGSRHTVDFYNGSYDDVQREAKSVVKLLIVFIHDPNNEDSKKLIHETLNSREFNRFVISNEVIVWGVASDSEEGKYVAYNLHVYKFPFVTMMCPRVDNRMFTVRRCSGFISAVDLVKKLQESVDITKDDIKALREQRDKLHKYRQIKEEQEREYKESVERDKRRMLEAKKVQREKQEAEEKERKRLNDIEERRKIIAAQRERLRQQLSEQPVGGEVVRIQKLFAAIICHETCPDFFTVFSGFPRCQIHCAPKWYHSLLSQQLLDDGQAPTKFHPASSFKEAGLKKAVGVFVNNCGT
ncbi:hypothetical protein RB195_012561 [Necator americanus]|uniref:UAS domain-containing protein n=1 Tax=Necator americanus TaxID=51031 RepID=A0ABR1DRJ2_NECAM